MDYQFYVDEYPDLSHMSAQEAADHYLDTGWQQGRNPTPDFDTSHYASSYPDVIAAGQNPFLHYLIYGKAEGRLPAPVAPASSGEWESPVRTWPTLTSDGASQRVLFVTSGADGELGNGQNLDWATLESTVRELGLDPSQAVLPEGREAIASDSLFWEEAATPHFTVIAGEAAGMRHQSLVQRWPATRFVYLSRGLDSVRLCGMADDQKSLRLKNKARRLLHAEVAMIGAFDACLLGTESDVQLLREKCPGRVKTRWCDFDAGFSECFEALIRQLMVSNR